MWYIIIFALAGIGIIAGFTSLTSCGQSSSEPKTDVPPDSIRGSYTRDEVEQMLKDLAERKVKDDLNMGAMCYSPRPYADSADYICPKCGEKTIFTHRHAEFVLHEIPDCRRMAAPFGPDVIKLEETAYCQNCNGGKESQPELCVIVSLEGAEPVRTCGISTLDMIILTDFLKGKNIYKTFNDEEAPLKDRIPRLKILLGIKD